MNVHSVRYALILLFALHISGCGEPEANPDLMEVTQGLSSGTTDTALPPRCAAWNVFRYDVPIYWGMPDSPTFTYSFQVQFASVGDYRTAPIGVMLNGGPGAPSIGYDVGSVFPASFNVIYTDVRGVGCNVNSANPFKLDALTTEYYSRDVLSIIQKLGLREYVLFGISYGTVHGTVMTSIAENEGIQAPTALVLEGILGNWSINAQDVVDYNKEWAKIKTILPPSVVDSFSRTPLPMGYSSLEWASFLSATLNEGTTPEKGNSTFYYLAALAAEDPTEAEARIRARMTEILSSPDPNTARIAVIGLCTETQGSHFDKDLVNGEIVHTGPDVCPLLGLEFTRPYDSAEHPVATVPIYYFEGSNDPNTSPDNAAYHFANQTQTNRVFTMVWGGGHPDMSRTLHQTGCTPAIFTAIATNPSGLGAALQQCHWPMSVVLRGEGQ